MSSDKHKKVLRHIVDQVYNTANTEPLEKFFDKGCVLHHPAVPEPVQGIEGIRGFMSLIFTAFPDFHAEVEDMVAEGDKVAIRSVISGTFKGPFAGIPPTSQHTQWSVTAIYRFVDGKVAEAWEDVDMLGAFQRLGVIPVLG